MVTGPVAKHPFVQLQGPAYSPGWGIVFSGQPDVRRTNSVWRLGVYSKCVYTHSRGYLWHTNRCFRHQVLVKRA